MAPSSRLPAHSPVFEAYWRFAVERQAMWARRQLGLPAPWTSDPILQHYRFTNAYRVLDRVSQYLIRNVAYQGSQVPHDVVLRTLLFKVFNKVSTWESLCEEFGEPCADNFNPTTYAAFLTDRMSAGNRIYSNAYIVPPLRSLPRPKHAGHLRLIATMLDNGLAAQVGAAASLQEAYQSLRRYEGLGDFLAFQYAIDLGYTTATDIDEADFVVAGPGAIDGLIKCFPDMKRSAAPAVIRTVCDEQEAWFEHLGLTFQPISGRRLQPIDCQNLFCEISKYSRVAFPAIRGTSGRSRIKQTFRAAGPVPPYVLPPKWTPADSRSVVNLGEPRGDVSVSLELGARVAERAQVASLSS